MLAIVLLLTALYIVLIVLIVAWFKICKNDIDIYEARDGTTITHKGETIKFIPRGNSD